jgi:hypothetical protein
MKTALATAALFATAAHLAAAGTVSAATLPFLEDFNDNVADGWTASSAWTAQNMQYEVGITGAALARVSTVDVTGTAGQPITVSTNYNLSSLDGTAAITAFGAGSSNTPYYLLDFDDTLNLRIFEITAGGNTQLATGAVVPGESFSLNTTYTLETTYTPSGGGLDISFDLLDAGGVVASASAFDPTPLTGDAFGVRVRTSSSSQNNSVTGFADNFSVTVVPEPTSAAAVLGGMVLLGSRRRRA